MDKLIPFVGKRDERREAKVDALLQQQLLITWLKESIKLPPRLLYRSFFVHCLALALFLSLSRPSKKKKRPNYREKCSFNFVIFLMNGCSSERSGFPSAARQAFDWLVFSRVGCAHRGGKKKRMRERNEVRGLGLMMKFQLREARERRASQVKQADKEEMIWRDVITSSEKADLILPEDTLAELLPQSRKVVGLIPTSLPETCFLFPTWSCRRLWIDVTFQVSGVSRISGKKRPKSLDLKGAHTPLCACACAFLVHKENEKISAVA